MSPFFRAVADVRSDPFFPCNWAVAFFWTVWHWREVRGYYQEH